MHLCHRHAGRKGEQLAGARRHPLSAEQAADAEQAASAGRRRGSQGPVSPAAEHERRAEALAAARLWLEDAVHGAREAAAREHFDELASQEQHVGAGLT